MRCFRVSVSCAIPLLLMVVTTGCAKVSEGQQRHRNQRRERAANQLIDQVVTLDQEEEAALAIASAKVGTKPMRQRLAAMGKVLADPTRMAIVSYPFPARIAELHVSIGDWIEGGEQLVTLQSEEVGSAKADFYEAEAGLELAQVSYERESRLHERGVGAKKDLLASEAELKVARARLEAAEKKLHLLGFSEEQVELIASHHQINPIITLFAPIAGKAAKINAVRGAMIDQGTEIMVIIDPSQLVVDAEIYERDIAAVHRGQTVEITVPAFPGESFTGAISYIGDLLNEATRTITVRSAVSNPDNKLKPGMFANVTIFVNHQEDVVVVPAASVLYNDEGTIVFIKDGHQYLLREVEVGAEEDGKLAILSGIAAGEQVVTAGAYQLKAKLHEDLLRSGQVH